MKELVQILKEKGMTIGSCESLTAGLFTSRMAEVPGASAVLKGGIVTYQTPIKEMVAHVSHEIIQEYGVISAECAEAMAVSGAAASRRGPLRLIYRQCRSRMHGRQTGRDGVLRAGRQKRLRDMAFSFCPCRTQRSARSCGGRDGPAGQAISE